MDLHVTFTKDGRVLVYDGEHQFGYATKIGHPPTWIIVRADGERFETGCAMLCTALTTVETRLSQLQPEAN